ncbi:kelch-like protein 8 [Physella acuta]|uniref:kelch-like protein 8 n=1 Tax=Physella acuta TaxID=109671 RepID=UPI0027DC5DAF|nr:kelch-like protein 8 [Physella acuta]
MGKPDFCTQIVQSLENVWAENILFDFAVRVHDEIIQCHRLILAACSDFFKALFRSGMKEATENCVEIKNVSCEVFRLILKSIYTGTSLLTLDNFIDVWHAAHMLQVKVMINVCEEFAITSCSLDTWENIYLHAKLLCSDRVLDNLNRFMTRNFEHIIYSSTFLQMSFLEIKNVIKVQYLEVGKEDVVLESVMKWVEWDTEKHTFSVGSKDLMTGLALPTEDKKTFKERESCRKDKLTELLMQVRTCLVSSAVLSRILKLNYVLENKDSRQIMIDALSYKAQDFKHGQWPSAAIHRSGSKYINAGIYGRRDGSYGVISAYLGRKFKIIKCEYLEETIQLVNFDGELFATGKQSNQPNGPCRMFVYCHHDWKEIMKMPSLNLLLVSHGEFIYIINKDDQFIYNINPKGRYPHFKKIKKLPANVEVKHAMTLENFLVLFSSESLNGIEKTAVHTFGILSNVWTRLDNLDGPAEQLISFRNDKHNYILQTNGSLCLVLCSSETENIEFKFLTKLWNFTKQLYGALTVQSQLIIFGNDPGNDPPNQKRISELPEHFTRISHWGNDTCCSNFVPITIMNSAVNFDRML